MSTVAAVGAPWIGLVCGLIAWFVTTWKRSGSISVATSGNTTNAVAGNITSWGVGFLMSGVLTLAFPAKYSSTDAAHIERSNKIQGIAGTPGEPLTPENSEKSPANSESANVKEAEADISSDKHVVRPVTAPEPESIVPTGNELVDFLESKQTEPMDPVEVKKSERLAIGANLVFFAVAIILVPFTLFGTGYVYNRAYFTGWVVVSFIWVWASMSICVIYPIVESTGALRDVSKGMWLDLKSLVGGKKPKAGETVGGA